MFQSRDIVSQGTIHLGARGPRTFVLGHIVLGRPVNPPSYSSIIFCWVHLSHRKGRVYFGLLLRPPSLQVALGQNNWNTNQNSGNTTNYCQTILKILTALIYKWAWPEGGYMYTHKQTFHKPSPRLSAYQSRPLFFANLDSRLIGARSVQPFFVHSLIWELQKFRN